MSEKIDTGKYYCLCIFIVLSTVVSVLSEESKILYEDSNFIVVPRRDVVNVDSTVIKKQLRILKKLEGLVACPDTAFDSIIGIKKPCKLTLRASRGVYSYGGKRVSVEFINDTMIELLSCVRPCRGQLNDEENRAFMKKEVLPGVVKISEEEAVAIAKDKFRKILKLYGKENELSVYDSVFVNYNFVYAVYFRVKVKNYIADNRGANMNISPIDGQMIRYSTILGGINLDPKIDLNYKPKFKYTGVEKILEKMKKDSVLARYTIGPLRLRPNYGHFKHWVWVQYGYRENQYWATELIIDSETGEILSNGYHK